MPTFGADFLTLNGTLTPVRALVKAITGVLCAIGFGIDALMTWQQRAEQRRCLRGLDDHLLKDIGLSRFDAEAEAAKPFWRG